MISAVQQTRIDVQGEFDLAASAQFLEGFTPAARPDAADESGTLRMAFPAEGRWEPVGVRIRQERPGEIFVDTEDPVVVEQVRRILSLDVDGRDFAAVGRADPVVGALQSRYPGLRPVLFYSPYEAACWTIIGHRIRMTQAARIKQRIAEEYGQTIDVAGRQLASFPAPAVLAGLERLPGLSELKTERLHAIAAAAEEGVLEAAVLRSLEAEDAMEQLRRLRGIGPFSAELILVRGAGHPDVFPRNEQRLHAEMRIAYDLPSADAAELAQVAERWRPFRSWVALLMRTNAEVRANS
ncbi:DNA-3-methyladenine glycosylase 2 family protein [Amycolatopsis sp. K13G38]|uniref:DNA-3-methyladenine glycosylase II n=1 Tax=Amycolatopsis acididurans TaxID=2724524 RepID=A0ABX1JCV9_9PSEU|nr:DNA-3-methyladenine glycosylase 2 family protein [Amycolatopsis acididurans]NKQ57569.1 DNA-3-methyladenine glycosylase 2 family protein [Amycolatopsis acididurans]